MGRITFISRTQTFGVLLVVLGHCTLSNNNALITPLWWIWFTSFFCSSFDMPLFMFFSGFLFCLSQHKKKLTYGYFMLHRAYKMLVPYFVLGSIGFVIKLLLYDYALRPVAFSWSSFFDGFLYPWHNPIIYLWFLPTLLFVFGILFFLNYIKSVGVAIAVLLLLVIVTIYRPLSDVEFLNLGGIIQYLLYFALGFYFYRLQGKFAFLNSLAFFVVSGLLLLILNLYTTRDILMLWLTKNGNDLLLACVGILFSLSFGHVLSKPLFNRLKIYDGLYFCMYLLSWFIITGVKIGYQKFYYSQNTGILMVLILILTLPLLARKYIKNTFARTVLGLS